MKYLIEDLQWTTKDKYIAETIEILVGYLCNEDRNFESWGGIDGFINKVQNFKQPNGVVYRDHSFVVKLIPDDYYNYPILTKDNCYNLAEINKIIRDKKIESLLK